jgi:hypothetical protein
MLVAVHRLKIRGEQVAEASRVSRAS